MNILEIVSKDEKINELYFIIARSHFLENEKKGILKLNVDENQYYDFLTQKTDMPKLSFSYEDNYDDYDENYQFLFQLNNNSYIKIDKIIPRKIFYNKILDQDVETCSVCGSNCKEIEKLKEDYQCSCCNNPQKINKIYECKRCCTQFIYF